MHYIKAILSKVRVVRIVVWVILIIITVSPLSLSRLEYSQARESSNNFFSNFEPKSLVSEIHIQNSPIIHGRYVSWTDSRLNDKQGRIMPRIYMKKLTSDEDKFAISFARKSGARTQYREKVIWAENTDRLREDNFDIKLFDFETGKLKSICKNKRMQNNPQISREFIIWKDLRDTPRGTDDIWDFAIYGISTSGDEEFVVKSHETPGTAELFGKYVAMSIRLEDKTDSDIYMHILSSGKRIPICTESGDQYNPKIIGDVLVWEDARNAPKHGYRKPTDIFGYSLRTHKELFISSNTEREYGLTVGGDRFAVWFQDTEGMQGALLNTIHGYDAIAGENFDICTKPGDYRNTVVGKNWIIWEDHSDLMFGADLKAFQISTGETFTLIKSLGDQINPSIYANHVVWENHGLPEQEKVDIWFADLEKLSPSKAELKYWGYRSSPVWNQAFSNPRHNGLAEAEIRDLNLFHFNQQWKTKLNGVISSAPCFDRRNFGYIGTGNGFFYKFSAFSGEIIWEQKLMGDISLSPAIYGDRVFVGTSTGKLYCLDTSEGSEIWNIQTAGAIDTSPTIYLSETDHYPMLIFSSADKTLHMYGVRGSKALKKWELKLDGWVKGSVSVDYNPFLRNSQGEPIKKYFIIGLSSNHVICIDPSTAEIISRFETDSPMKSSPIVAGSTTITSSDEGTLYCTDFTRWGRPPQLHFEERTYHKTSCSPAFDPSMNRIYYESKTGAISGYNSELLWTNSLGTPLSSAPAISYSNNGISGVFVTSTGGIVALLNPDNGEILWKTELDTTLSSSPSILDTGFISIFLGTNDSYLYCWSQRPNNID